VVAEVRAFFVADLLGGRFPAMLGDARVMVDAESADMQLGAALRADIEPSQGQGKRR
jgi:hypothetical protein